MKLALGTAQFGMPYGIANRAGQVPDEMAGAILECARQNGIDTIDTAIGYADSEAVLGRLGVADMRIITKVSAMPDDTSDATRWITSQIDASLERLRIPRLTGVLLHRPGDLLGERGSALSAALLSLKESGRVEKIGMSVYCPEELDELARVCPIDIVQAPMNLIDRRLLRNDWLARLRQKNVEVHVRSVFLQGLLLMQAAERPERFARWAHIWQEWDRWLVGHPDESAVSACLSFALKHSSISRLVVGVDSVAQLQGIIAAANGSRLIDLPDLSSEDENLINPALWAST